MTEAARVKCDLAKQNHSAPAPQCFQLCVDTEPAVEPRRCAESRCSMGYGSGHSAALFLGFIMEGYSFENVPCLDHYFFDERF